MSAAPLPAIPEETLALISAAVALTLQKPHQILAVSDAAQPLEVPLYTVNLWSMEGRFQHFGSHKVR